MAVQVKLLIKNQPIITDLRPGRVRKTLYSPPNDPVSAWLLAAVGIGAIAIAPGIYRMFTGPTERAQAIERLKIDQLEAKLNHDNAKIEKLQAESEKIRLALSPSIEEERQEKIKVIRENLPLDLWRKEITNDALELELELNRSIAPTVTRLKQLAADNQADLIRQRQQQHEASLELAELARERAAAETERIAAETDQRELNTRLVETAIDGLDYFSKQIFLRDRLFPPVAAPTARELTLQGRPLRSTTTITAF